jgi:hypothetical protein
MRVFPGAISPALDNAKVVRALTSDAQLTVQAWLPEPFPHPSSVVPRSQLCNGSRKRNVENLEEAFYPKEEKTHDLCVDFHVRRFPILLAQLVCSNSSLSHRAHNGHLPDPGKDSRGEGPEPLAASWGGSLSSALVRGMTVSPTVRRSTGL